MPRRLYITLCWIMTVFLVECVFRVASHYSYQIRFYTNNPYQQRFLDDVTDWKGIAASTLCPMPSGSVLNGFVINSRGNISPEVSYEKLNGTKRLVLVGDSHAVGAVPYPDHFIRVLERRINDTAAHSLEVVNLSLNCIGPLIEEKILATEGIRYSPDVVVLAFFVGNDFTDDRVYKEKFVKAKKSERHLLPQLLYQSQLMSFLRNFIMFHRRPHNAPTLQVTSIGKPGTYIGSVGFDQKRPSFPEEEYLDIEKDRSEIFIHDSGAYDDVDVVRANILTMKKISDAVHAKFVVLVIPDEMQVDMSLLRKVASSSGRNIDAFDMDYPQRLLKEYFEKNDIDYIDMLSSWKASSASGSYYLVQDSHLNIEGNTAIADLLYPKVQALLED